MNKNMFFKGLAAVSLASAALIAYAEGNTIRIFQKNEKLDCEQIVAEFPASSIGHLQIDDISNAKEVFTVNGVSFTMIRVDGGSYQMGSSTGTDETPVHEENVSTFYIGETEVTRALWNAVMNGSGDIANPQKPYTIYAWGSIQDFIKKLNLLTGRQFRLPTEVEWEYAARGGVNWTDNYTYSGCNEEQLNDYAWYSGNTTGVNDVKTKKPNQLGIYDMTGNVQEWCANFFTSSYAPDAQVFTEKRAIRGGCWHNAKGDIRVAYRDRNPTTYDNKICGLRLAL